MSNSQEKDECKCPYCHGQVDPRPPFCQPCGKEFEICKGCGKPIPRDAEYCPRCAPERSPGSPGPA